MTGNDDHRRRRLAILCANVVLILILGWIDHVTGWELGFFAFYFIPISVVAWNLRWGATLAISIMCALVWFIANISTFVPYSHILYFYWDAFIRLLSFLLIGHQLNRIRGLLENERRISSELREAMSQFKTLRGMIPICAHCKKIRNDKGDWQRLEAYLKEHSDAVFTHGICQECYDEQMRKMEKNPPKPPMKQDELD